jgi:hypothetical protein
MAHSGRVDTVLLRASAPMRPLVQGASRLCVALAFFSLFGCSSAGPWGFSRVYSPLSEEEDIAEGARDYDPVMAAREPESWRGVNVSAFGVVMDRAQSAGGAADLTLGLRTLSERNLCDSPADDSCRVTVSDRDFATFHASVKLRPGDDIGKQSVQVGALVRVIGKLADGPNPRDGLPVIQAIYYRHWPRMYYVTTASAANMRR